FGEAGNPEVRINIHDAKGGGHLQRYFDAANSDIRTALNVGCQHGAVVHLVNMITGKNQNVFGVVAANDIQVLQYRIRRAGIPGGFQPLLRRQKLDKLTEFPAEKPPAPLHVAIQRMRFILCQHADPADAGIDAVGEWKINDAKLSTKMYGRFSTPVGELV